MVIITIIRLRIFKSYAQITIPKQILTLNVKKNKYDSFFNAKDFNLVKNEVELKRKKYCIICGNEIVKGNKKYCSKECAQIASHKFEVTSAQLINDFKELKTFCAVGKKYNVSDNAIKKRCKKLGILDDISQYITHRGKKL